MKSALTILLAALFFFATNRLSAQVKPIKQVRPNTPGVAKVNPNDLPVLKIEFENKTLLPGQGIQFNKNSQAYTIGLSEKITLTADEGIEITGDYPNLKIGLKKHTIGEEYLDGTIFYVDESGQHGLIYCASHAPTTWSTFQWEYPNGDVDNNEIKNLNTFASGIGMGKYNTMCILLADNIDLNIVDPGDPFSIPYFLRSNSNDWYVPSFAELKLLYENRALLGIQLPSKGRVVWSSTEGGIIHKGYQDGPLGEDMPSGWNFEGYNGHKVDLTSEPRKARNGVKCIDFYTGNTVNISKTYGKTLLLIQAF